jgi:hypothetical protein
MSRFKRLYDDIQFLKRQLNSLSRKVIFLDLNTFSSDLAIEGNTTLGDASTDIVTVTAQLTASQGGYFADKVGVGESSPDVVLHVKNASGVNAPVMKIEQLDTDEPFIRFQGTSDSDTSKSITTETSIGAHTGYIRININGTDRWIPFYATS